MGCPINLSANTIISVEEPDIIELETRYWHLKGQSKTGRFDMETFQAAVCPPVPHTLAQGSCQIQSISIDYDMKEFNPVLY